MKSWRILALALLGHCLSSAPPRPTCSLTFGSAASWKCGVSDRAPGLRSSMTRASGKASRWIIATPWPRRFFGTPRVEDVPLLPRDAFATLKNGGVGHLRRPGRLEPSCGIPRWGSKRRGGLISTRGPRLHGEEGAGGGGRGSSRGPPSAPCRAPPTSWNGDRAGTQNIDHLLMLSGGGDEPCCGPPVCRWW